MRNKHLQLKICGMTDPENIRAAAELKPEYIGFIFYTNSPRYPSDLEPAVIKALDPDIKTVGVFVDEDRVKVLRTARKFGLQAVQLHGHESPSYCQMLREEGLQVIKAFGIDANFNFSVLPDYEAVTDYFLFDTRTYKHGGSGQSFDWQLLEQYQLKQPYFLSGGIDINSLAALEGLKLDNPPAGIDVNSRFEKQPGLKDITILQVLKKTLES